MEFIKDFFSYFQVKNFFFLLKNLIIIKLNKILSEIELNNY